MTYRGDYDQPPQCPREGYWPQRKTWARNAWPQQDLAPWKPRPSAPMHRKPRRKRDVILLSAAGLIAILAIATAVSHPTTRDPAARTPATSGAAAASSSGPAPAASAASAANAAGSCGNRPWASGDIYVRMLSPGVNWETRELGGAWSWDSSTGQCLTSVQWVLATAPLAGGSCTQVGYVADNPGYDANATVAAPLRNLAAEAGPGC